MKKSKEDLSSLQDPDSSDATNTVIDSRILRLATSKRKDSLHSKKSTKHDSITEEIQTVLDQDTITGKFISDLFGNILPL